MDRWVSSKICNTFYKYLSDSTLLYTRILRAILLTSTNVLYWLFIRKEICKVCRKKVDKRLSKI